LNFQYENIQLEKKFPQIV